MRLPGGLLLALLLGACLGARADESRAYHGLWGGLFRQQEAAQGGNSGQPAGDALRQALADLQAWLAHSPPAAPAASGSRADGGPARRLPLDEFLPAHLNWTLSLLDHGGADLARSGSSAGTGTSVSGNGTAAASSSLLQRLHDHVAADLAKLDPQQLATLAAVQAWALGTLLAGGSGGSSTSASSSLRSSGGADAGSASPALAASHHVADPASSAFKGLTCMRLQNFGNAEGYYSALLGPSPCAAPPSSGSAGSGAAAASAARGEALRWGSRASFLLDCSPGSSAAASDASSGAEAAGGGGGSSSALSSMLHAAANKVAVAFDRTTTCRLAVTTDASGVSLAGSGSGAAGSVESGASSGGGGSTSGVVLEHVFGRPLLGAPKLDALRIRACNMPPSSLQYPAALARGAAISLHSLKLNGRSLLPAALQASQAAAAADGCLAQLLRIPAKATKSGFVLTGWVRLDETSSSAGGGAGGASFGSFASPSSGFGVGEMASIELQLGEYSLLDAATSRLLGALGSGSSAGGASDGEGLPA